MLTDWQYFTPAWSMTEPSPDGCLALSDGVLYYRQGTRPAIMCLIDGSILSAPPTAILDWYADRVWSVQCYLEGSDVTVDTPVSWLRYWHTRNIRVRIASIEGAYLCDYGNAAFLETRAGHQSIPCGRHGCERPLELLIWLAGRSPIAREILTHE